MQDKNYLLVNIGLMILSIDNMLNDYYVAGILFAVIGLYLQVLKMKELIDIKTMGLSLFIIITSLSMFSYVGLLSNVNGLILIVVLNGANTALWFNYLMCMKTDKYQAINKIINVFIIITLILTSMTYILPDNMLNYFLYPDYLSGGYVLAMLAIIYNLFGYIIVLAKGIHIYQQYKKKIIEYDTIIKV